MPISSADRAMLYASYAEMSLKAVTLLPDREARVIHREMAAEWLMLADQAAISSPVRGEPLDAPAPRHIRSVG